MGIVQQESSHRFKPWTNILNEDSQENPVEVNSRNNCRKSCGTQDIELILATPTSKIILRIEETDPIDVFYSPTQKDVIKRQRKKG